MIQNKWVKTILVILLVVTTILHTLYFEYPTHPDHYTLGQFTYALIQFGYAPWVLHWSSIFGYYPLSIASGFEFFMAVLNALTGLELPVIFYIFSSLSAVIAVLGVFLLMREFNAFETSYITALIFSTMVLFAKNVSNTASSRMFNIIFYPLFILVLFRIYSHFMETKKVPWNYVVTGMLMFIMMHIIHRLAQLLFIFILAFIGAIIFMNFGAIIGWLRSKKPFSWRNTLYNKSILLLYIDLAILPLILFALIFLKVKLIWFIFTIVIVGQYFWFDFYIIRKRNRSQHLIFFDMCMLIGYLILAKIADLLFRGRLLPNITRLSQKYAFQAILIGGILITFILVGIWYLIRDYGNILASLKLWIYSFKKQYIDILILKQQRLISLGLLFLLFFLVSRNFTGDNFYRFGLDHYSESFLISGNSPWIIMINFIFNLNNNVSIFIYFVTIGILFLLWKTDKTFYDYFFIFVIIGFSQFILDWEYIRLYILPIYAILIGLGISFSLNYLTKNFGRRQIFIGFMVIFSIHLVITNIFIQREQILNQWGFVENQESIPEQYYIAAGEYLMQYSEPNTSIHTSSSIDFDRNTAYYSQKIMSVAAESIFVADKNYEIEKRTFQNIWDSFMRGEKVRDAYHLKDLIFGSYYYTGRHISFLNGRTLGEGNVREVIDLYNIQYLMDGPSIQEKTRFFNSISVIKNKIYSSDLLTIYNLKGGRIE